MAHSFRAARQRTKSFHITGMWISRKSAARLAITALMLLAPLLAHADIIHVDGGAGGGNDGSSWNDAHTDLQDALAGAGPGDEIWVAAGVYKPTDDPTERSATFALKNGVAIYGGFDGTETVRGVRDPNANVTVLSGDIDDNDTTDGNGVIVSAAGINGANSFHVTTGSNTDATAILDGFTVTAGLASGADNSDNRGGGMFVSVGTPKLVNVRFRGNRAVKLDGGGMYNSNGSPVLTNVVFSGNQAAVGGGMSNQHGDPVLTNVTFRGNLAADSDGDGGGMFNHGGSPVLTNVTFSGNRAGRVGGGIASTGAFPVFPSDPVIRNVIFWNNRDSNGTGTATASISNVGDSYPTINHSLVQGCNPGGSWNTACGTDEDNNLADDDPMFVNPPDPAAAPTAAGDVRLLARSPAVDAGNDSFFSDIGTATDIDANDRLFGDNVDLGPFETAYLTVSLSTAGEGNGDASVTSPQSEPPRFDLNETVTIEAVPAQSSNFDGWTGDHTAADNPLAFTINTDTALTASFTLKSFEVTATTASGNGTIDPSSQSVDFDGAASLTVTPNTGWSVDQVTGDTCTPVNTTGTTWEAANIQADCIVDASFLIDSFNIGGTASGLDGDGLELALNGNEILPIADNGIFQFNTELDHDTNYTVTVETNPSSPLQTCTIANATGAVNTADIDDIDVACATDTFTVGGSVSGLQNGQVVLQNNGDDDLAIDANGAFAFATALADGSDYMVTVATQPAGQQCIVAGGTDTLAGDNVTGADVDCSNIEMTLDFSDLDFGNLTVGQSDARSVTISNAGSPNLVIDGFDLPDAPFTLDPGTCNPLPRTLAAGETCTVELSFQSGIEGKFGDTLGIDSNAISSPDSIALSASVSAAIPVPALRPLSLLLLILLTGITARPLLQRL